MVTVVPGVGWSGHDGDVRLVVLPGRRGHGIGRTLAQRALQLARSLGLAKLVIEIMATNNGGLAMFRALGFADEARLHGQVRDGEGTFRDLVMLSRWLGKEPKRCQVSVPA